MSRFLASLLTATLIGLLSTTAESAMLSPGDIVVTDFAELGSTAEDGAIFKIDPLTGDREIISSATLGSGPKLVDPWGILIDQDGSLIVSDISTGRVFRIDPVTGNRQIISGPTVGVGPSLSGPTGLIRTQQEIIVADMANDALIRIDSTTGDRSIISGAGIGSGPSFSVLMGLAQRSSGSILVADHGAGFGIGRIFQVDIATGDRTLVAGTGIGTGATLAPFQLALELEGTLLTTNDFIGAVIRTDPTTGESINLSGNLATSEIAFGIAVDGNGGIIVSDGVDGFAVGDGVIHRFDPNTGVQQILSGPGIGTGPLMNNPGYIAIVAIPEPSSAVLFIVGVLLSLAGRFYIDRTDRRSSAADGLYHGYH